MQKTLEDQGGKIKELCDDAKCNGEKASAERRESANSMKFWCLWCNFRESRWNVRICNTVASCHRYSGRYGSESRVIFRAAWDGSTKKCEAGVDLCG